ncbi:oxidoreductase [Lapillicoccus jejuensis]|uniref:NAD(P)-dependent dehydrogenase (Short-subunit alcohol dehydrogenase family) n=1 Tax=Lapillicoccus jejuensis TaxID=402171 RepID=A0A542E2B9_9MICO|nr:oxidoreductase [Lapillicoccus jejuensis]TQJ09483.1 NAD(P)-dependent dehydrogenase (short-subunit alcohol dehydrogenase family) [Lapillicoccus jejuensis]
MATGTRSWSIDAVPDQTGRTVVVTGANSGIGLEASKVLSGRGARVVLACRDPRRGEVAREQVGGAAEVRALDLADLASVRDFADGLDGEVDVLVLNAGVMAPPLSRTVDGFESQLGTNVVGHAALTARLLPQVTDRVVWLSSMMHRFGSIDLADLNWEHRRYRRWSAYGQSKLADLMLAYELQRRLTLAGSSVRSVAAHPGYSSTNLQQHAAGPFARLNKGLQDLVARTGIGIQSAEAGAWPTLMAATDPDLPGGSYVGPGGPAEMTGAPRVVGSTDASHDAAVQNALFDQVEELAGVTFGLPR